MKYQAYIGAYSESFSFPVDFFRGIVIFISARVSGDDQYVVIAFVFVHNAVIADVPVFDPVTPGIATEQDHKIGIDPFLNNFSKRLELVSLTFRQM
jgi:hypothetical protein